MNGIARLCCSLAMSLFVNAAVGGGTDGPDPGAHSGVAPAVPAAALELRLEHLVQALEQRRRELHIPGLAIAVVKDDRIILARGFGFASLEERVAVTPATLFPIGSSTKPFTATLIGMLVDQGKMSWDDPVTEHIPFFKLDVDSDREDAVATIRDLLAHRTGFARMTLLFVGGDASPNEVLHAAARAEPWTGFRQRFLYSNVMYLAAGVAAGNAAGSDWDRLVTEQLLEPLGMNRSGVDVRLFQNDQHLSAGYDWNEDRQVFDLHEARDNRLIAPAGAIVSNALEMAQWVRFQLGRGRYEGRRLLSETQLRETWTPQIAVPGRGAYGLGWMLSEWNGQPVVEHGGNTRGYAAQVALLPESDLGFVLLANVTATPLQRQSMDMVWEAVLGTEHESDAAPVERQQPGDDYGAYVGAYLPTHRQAEFTISEQNGRLALLMPPRPQPLELKPPDEDGRWYLALSDQLAVSFERDDAGGVTSMKIYQGPQVFECVRAGVELSPEIVLAELAEYLGSYRSEASGTTVRAFIQNNRLAIDVPGRVVFELRPPTPEGRWAFRIDSSSAASFNEAADGRIASLTFHQPGAPDVEFVRVAGDALPTLDELSHLRGPEERTTALEGLGVFRLRGTVRLVHAGVEGTVDWHIAGTDRLRRESDYGKFGFERLTLNGDRAWTEAPGSPLRELHGKFLQQAQQSHPAAMFADWADFYESTRVLRVAERDGIRVYVVELAGGDVPDAIAYVDADTGDVVRLDAAVIEPTSTIAIPIEITYEDYREIEGVRIPFRTVTSSEVFGRVVVQFDRIDVRLEVDAGFFTAGAR